MDAAPVHKVSVNLLDPSDFVLELHEGAMTVELVPVQCPFHDSMHVIKVSFVGVILLTTGVIYVLGNSGMLTPLYTLLSAIIAAGSTLNDEGMLNEVGMEDSREGISAEHAVARVVRAIRLLWKASLRGRAVVTRLLNEASTEQVRVRGST